MNLPISNFERTFETGKRRRRFTFSLPDSREDDGTSNMPTDQNSFFPPKYYTLEE